MAEGFPTLVTFVGFLSGVDCLVLGQEDVTKTLATLATFVGLLPCVDFLVADDVTSDAQTEVMGSRSDEKDTASLLRYSCQKPTT